MTDERFEEFTNDLNEAWIDYKLEQLNELTFVEEYTDSVYVPVNNTWLV